MKINFKRAAAAVLLGLVLAASLAAAACDKKQDVPAGSAAGTETEPAAQKAPPQNKNELAAWLTEAYRNAERVFSLFTGYGKLSYDSETAEIDGHTYQKVAEREFNSRAGLEALCKNYFDAKTTASLMDTRVGNAYLFADHDGALYRFGGYAGLMLYDIGADAKFELISAWEDGASFTMTCTAELYGRKITASQDYYVEYIDGRPVFGEFSMLAEALEKTFNDQTEGGRFSINAFDDLPGLVFRDLKMSNGAEWVPLASYGPNAVDYTFSDYYKKLDENIINFWPGDDGERFVTLGYRAYKNAGNNYSEYRTFCVTSKNGEIESIVKTDLITKKEVLNNGKPYTGILDGTYKCKSYSSVLDALFIRTVTFSGGDMTAYITQDGTDAMVMYNGSFKYDTSTGVLTAQLEQSVADEEAESGKRVTGTGVVSGNLLVYSGYMQFVCAYSEFKDLSPSDPLPLTFALPDARTNVSVYRPEGAVELLFCHKIFANSIYLLSYRTEPKSVCVYYTEDDGGSYKRLDIALPEGIKYDSAEAVFDGGGGGSGEAGFYVELKRGSETEYLHYNNYAYTGPEDFLVFTTDGKAVPPKELLCYSKAPVVFPNTSLPASADEVSELDALGLPDGDKRIAYIKAFLGGDTEELERLCSVSAGMYDAYKTVSVSRFVAYIDPGDAYEGRLHFSFFAEKSGVDAFAEGGWNEFVVENGVNGVYIYPPAVSGPAHESAAALRQMLNSVYFFTIPADNNMEEYIRWSITEYICNRLGANEYHTLDEVAACALEVFGIKDFTPDKPHQTEEGCSTVPNGGIARFYELTQINADENNAEYTVQFYADCSKTVKSHAYKYTMKKVGGGWVFTGSEEAYHAQYEPVQWGN